VARCVPSKRFIPTPFSGTATSVVYIPLRPPSVWVTVRAMVNVPGADEPTLARCVMTAAVDGRMDDNGRAWRTATASADDATRRMVGSGSETANSEMDRPGTGSDSGAADKPRLRAEEAVDCPRSRRARVSSNVAGAAIQRDCQDASDSAHLT